MERNAGGKRVLGKSNEKIKKVEPVVNNAAPETTPKPSPSTSFSLQPAKLSLPPLERTSDRSEGSISGTSGGENSNSSMEQSTGSLQKRTLAQKCHLGPGITPPVLFGMKNEQADADDSSSMWTTINTTVGSELDSTNYFADDESSMWTTINSTGVGSELDESKL